MVATATNTLFDEVPDKTANWDLIRDHARTFDTYWLNDNTGDAANLLYQAYMDQGEATFSQLDIETLRSSLYYEQIRFRHLGSVPQNSRLSYVQDLMCAIRERLIDDHFRFRKPALRFSITNGERDNLHVLSDGIFMFVYRYDEQMNGSGDCMIIKPEKSQMKNLNSFLLTQADSWEKKYEDLSSTDGTNWELKINIKGLNTKISGVNAFPENWDEFNDLLRKVITHSKQKSLKNAEPDLADLC